MQTINLTQSILNRYITHAVILATSLIVLVLFGVETFLGLAAQLPEIGKGSYDIWRAIEYVVLFDPLVLYQFFPIACLLGSLVGLGGLATSYQLIAMRAAGFSILQVIGAVIRAALIMLVVVILIGEGVAPKWVDKATTLKREALGQNNDSGAFEGIWLKQKGGFVHVDDVVSDSRIEGVTQYSFAENNKLQSVITSSEGVLEGKVWRLHDSVITQITPEKVSVKKIAGQSMQLKIKRKLVTLINLSADQQDMSTLYKSYHYRKQTGLSYTSLELSFWQRLFQPLIVVVMLCLGVPFVFGSLRDSGMGARLLTGSLLGFGFYVLNQFSGRFSLALNLPALLAALFPVVVFALVCLYLLWRVER